jgi:Stress responsive A/B Barrel Domain
MLHHVVTFELNADAPEGQAERICEALRAFGTELPEMRSFDAGADLGLREGNASLAMVATFDDFDDFLVYANHPEHVQIVQELILPHLEDGQRVQFTS